MCEFIFSEQTLKNTISSPNPQHIGSNIQPSNNGQATSPSSMCFNPPARNPSPVRLSGISGDNRREFHLATQNLSKTATEAKGQVTM